MWGRRKKSVVPAESAGDQNRRTGSKVWVEEHRKRWELAYWDGYHHARRLAKEKRAALPPAGSTTTCRKCGSVDLQREWRSRYALAFHEVEYVDATGTAVSGEMLSGEVEVIAVKCSCGFEIGLERPLDVEVTE